MVLGKKIKTIQKTNPPNGGTIKDVMHTVTAGMRFVGNRTKPTDAQARKDARIQTTGMATTSDFSPINEQKLRYLVKFPEFYVIFIKEHSEIY